MARITVEDCLEKVDNHFQLVLLAAKRARQLAMGAQATVPWENDKPTVVALREIALGKINYPMLDQIGAQEKARAAERAAQPRVDIDLSEDV